MTLTPKPTVLPDPEDVALVKKMLRRADRARDFPTHTCPASRHVHIMAKALAKGKSYPMLQEEPLHCATSLLGVLASLWEGRRELTKLNAKLERAVKKLNAASSR